MINRRAAIKRLTLGGIAVAAAPPWVERLCALAANRPESHLHPHLAPEGTWTAQVFDAHQNETVIVLSELIIPQTETAGAKAARVNEFIDTVLADAEESERAGFLSGLEWMDLRSQELFGTDLIGAAPEQQTALLTIVSSPHNRSLGDQPGCQFFEAIKRLTITGYYTSSIGMKEELDDDGSRFFPNYAGCTHPEHKA
jgi:hypothetical protein